MLRAASFLFVLAMAAPALAQDESAPMDEPSASASASASADVSVSMADVDTPNKPGAFVIGGEIGGIFPQPFTELGTHIAFGLEVGYRLPFVGQRIEIMLDAGYSPPNNSFKVTRREGEYSAKIVSQQLHFSLGPRFRVMEGGVSPWNMTIGLGPRLFLLRSISSGSRDGNKMIEYREQSSQVGFFAGIGGEYTLGPGALFLDADLGYAKMNHRISGDVNTGNITLTLGYRLFL
jgi:hypothetical protein